MTGRPSATGAPRPHPDHEPGSDPPPAKGWKPQREDCPRGSVREEQTTVIRGAQSDRVENALITDELLTIAQAADWLGTSVRFPRRLITERRITFVRVGRHVRIPASALAAYVRANTVEPVGRGS
jgi:excisionase family DNA binding protein